MKNISKFLVVVIILLVGGTVFVYFFKNIEIKKINLSEIAPADISLPVSVPSPVQEKKFNIFIIPGHDVADSGAKYKNIYEKDLVVSIAEKIANILNKQEKYNVILSRDENNWNPALLNYFQDQRQIIIDWKNQRQAETSALLNSGKIKTIPDIGFHSEVAPDMSVKLYGMNKWANENNVDLVLNLHFNDSVRPNMNLPGTFKGFDIFIPESQMKNSVQSRIAAQDIFDQLISIEPSESNNLLEDQSLIALGASGTLNVPSMLIEYAYIYEKMLLSDDSREGALDKMAQQTALGIENYFNTPNN